MANIDNVRYILSRKISYLIPKKMIEELFLEEIKEYSKKINKEKDVEYVIDTMLNDLNNNIFYILVGVHYYLGSFNRYYNINFYDTENYKHIPSYNNVEFYLSKENFEKMIDERNALNGSVTSNIDKTGNTDNNDSDLSDELYKMIEEELINNEYNYGDYIIARKKYVIDCILRAFEDDEDYVPELRETYIRHGYELLDVTDTNEFSISKEEKEEFTNKYNNLKSL